MPELPQRTVGRATGGNIHVQSGRTTPQMNFLPGSGLLQLPTNDDLASAPEGTFEIRDLWNKAVSGAETYFYAEDQMLWSSDVCGWLNERLRADSDFRVILLTGLPDPNDPPSPIGSWLMARAVNHHLARALSDEQLGRVGLFQLRDKVVHCKTFVVDDRWAQVGSGNFARRSLYTDIEHCYAFMDEDERAVPAFRQLLWDSVFGAPEPAIGAAVARWFAIAPGGRGGAGGGLQRMTLPLAMPTLELADQLQAEALNDVDSRQMWGSQFLSLFTGGI